MTANACVRMLLEFMMPANYVDNACYGICPVQRCARTPDNLYAIDLRAIHRLAMITGRELPGP